MADYLGCLEYNSKEKANEGNIRKIIGDSKNVKNAIKNQAGFGLILSW